MRVTRRTRCDIMHSNVWHATFGHVICIHLRVRANKPVRTNSCEHGGSCVAERAYVRTCMCVCLSVQVCVVCVPMCVCICACVCVGVNAFVCVRLVSHKLWLIFQQRRNTPRTLHYLEQHSSRVNAITHLHFSGATRSGESSQLSALQPHCL